MAGSGVTTPQILWPSGCGRSGWSRTPSVHAWAFARSLACSLSPTGWRESWSCNLVAAWKKNLVMRCHDQRGWWTSLPRLSDERLPVGGKPASHLQSKCHTAWGSVHEPTHLMWCRRSPVVLLWGAATGPTGKTWQNCIHREMDLDDKTTHLANVSRSQKRCPLLIVCDIWWMCIEVRNWPIKCL